MSHGSVHKSHHLCINILFDHFVGQHIKMPTAYEAKQEAQAFHSLSHFPPLAWGAIGILSTQNMRFLA
jgi:hypothetical protein